MKYEQTQNFKIRPDLQYVVCCKYVIENIFQVFTYNLPIYMIRLLKSIKLRVGLYNIVHMYVYNVFCVKWLKN